MNKSLESFYELKKVILDLFVNVGDCKEQLDIIETELKRLEKQDEILRIIKEKKVNINFLNNCISYGNYLLGSYPRDISKEEFDLLKEWLK